MRTKKECNLSLSRRTVQVRCDQNERMLSPMRGVKRMTVLFVITLFMTLPGNAQTVNLAFQKAVYQSSSIDYDKCGHLMTDGSDITFWQAKGVGPSWVYTDLGEVCTISGATIKWGQNGSACYKIEGSAQNSNPTRWEEIYVCTDGRGVIDTIHFPKEAKARFVRLYISENVKPNESVVIKEWEIYGRLPGTPEPKPELNLIAGDWRIQSTLFAEDDGFAISSKGYDDSKWVVAKVPGTVMGSYYAAGALPDPYYGDQMHMISEEFFSRGSFWYRSVFHTPRITNGDQVILWFGGINWKSDIYVNRKKVGSVNGAFKRSRFDVTDLLAEDGANYVAVHIKKLDHPGSDSSGFVWRSGMRPKVSRKYLGAPTFNGGVIGYDSPTFLASTGWNWLPIVRGRELGIWDHAGVCVEKGVEIVDPWIETRLNLPDTIRSSLTFRTRIVNHKDQVVDGVLKLKTAGVTISRKVSIQPKASEDILLDKSVFPELEINNPTLWWPNGYGFPHLHEAEVVFEIGGAELCRKELKYGIRDLECKIENNILYVYVNGYRIQIRGGNWGLAEGMLNCDRDGYDLRVRLHKEANFNMIRNWVGQTGHDEFYGACDQYGILVFDDFWLANPVDGPEPLDFRMFLDNVADKIKRVRVHPSVAFYCGRNEGDPSESLDAGMRETVAIHDPSRHYESNSADGHLTGLGPYEPMEPVWYFRNRGNTFHSELGIIAIPEAESIKAMMPSQYWWPINDMWAVHDYQSPRSQTYSKYINRKYGYVDSLEEYTKNARLANMEISKAMFETYRSQQGSGMLLWMSQSAWPSLICQIYDHYFEMTSSYFAVKKACEPVHILYNPLTRSVEAANNSLKKLNNAVYEIRVYGLDGKVVSRQTGVVSLPVATTVLCAEPDIPLELENKVYFLKLTLSENGKVISDNFYWSEDGDRTSMALNEMNRAKPKVSLAKSQSGGKEFLKVRLENDHMAVALMLRLKICDRDTGERILPVIYSDNYVSLLPGEVREIVVEYAAQANRNLSLIAEGHNVDTRIIPIR